MMSRTGTVSTAGNEFTEYITSNIESSSDPENHYADLVDIIRIAMGRIKTGIYNNQVMQKERFHKFPCVICDKNYNVNQQSIYCTQCSNWGHRKCNGTSKAEFDILVEEADDIPFHCILCSIQNNAEIFHFGYSSSSELLDLFGIDLPSQLVLLPTFETLSKLSNLPNLNDCDMDENLIHTIDRKYHEIPEFSKLNHAIKMDFHCFI